MHFFICYLILLRKTRLCGFGLQTSKIQDIRKQSSNKLKKKKKEHIKAKPINI